MLTFGFDSKSKKPLEVPLSTLNRHGLISGTTGSGKTRAMQRIAEQMQLNGINVFLSDVKGDCSGFFKAGDQTILNTRNVPLGNSENASSFPATYWSVSNAQTPLRFAIDKLPSELVSRLLGLNETQESYVEVALLYAREKKKRIITLTDLLVALEEASTRKKGMVKSTLGVIERKIETLVSKGIDQLFGANDLEIKDILNGTINVLNLSDVRDSEELLGLVNAFLLYYAFDQLKEIGDTQKPKLCIFFDEAHYLFENANKSLIRLMEKILRQIRSKGVGVFFVTHDALDVPETILKMLAFKIVFAMRAFTQNDVAHLKAISQGFPKSPFKIEEELKDLEKGECFITFLEENGQMSPVHKVKVFAPQSSMESFALNELPKNKEYGQKYANTRTPKTTNKQESPQEKTAMTQGKEIDFTKGAMAVLMILLNGITFIGKALFETLLFFLKKPKRIVYLAMFILFVAILVAIVWFAYKNGWLS